MHLVYIDESGNIGAIAGGGTLTFTLGCVLVEARKWPDVFDDLIQYRRFLKDRFGIPVRAEIKANYLLHNGGPFRQFKLSERARFAVYRGMMRLQSKLGIWSFAVVVRKDVMGTRGLPGDPREIAWEFLLQRLERFTTKTGTQAMLIHDEGEGGIIRSLARKARRAGIAGSAFGSGVLKRPARLILDDPSSRKSHESYFVQLADLDAYAAFRHYYPPPPRNNIAVVSSSMWNELGTARYAPVNEFAGGTPGIVVWPK